VTPARNPPFARGLLRERDEEDLPDSTIPLVIGLEHTDSTRRGANEQGSD
jgi:hypothetical protein